MTLQELIQLASLGGNGIALYFIWYFQKKYDALLEEVRENRLFIQGLLKSELENTDEIQAIGG